MGQDTVDERPADERGLGERLPEAERRRLAVELLPAEAAPPLLSRRPPQPGLQGGG